ncbi:hypothetical protein ABT263_12565 [Kitasatospora sp. NPDC001603]|uniref:hypothetical protein n=1 Tax=Kitasatospora sp. NPDC001603 TaxID=3154388 RepID=UPI00331EAECC
MTTPHNGDWDDDLADVLQRLVTLAPPAPAPHVPPMPSAPPMPTVPPQSPPAAAAGTGPVVDEWWRKSGPVVHTPVPLGGDQPAGRLSFEAAAQAFWAPVGQILTQQVPHIAEQVGQQVTQLMTETEAQRHAREQVQYEAVVAAQRAVRDSQFAAAGESTEQRAERHRVEQVLAPGHRRDDLVGMVDLLADRIGETPEERTARRRAEHELDRQRARARRTPPWPPPGRPPSSAPAATASSCSPTGARPAPGPAASAAAPPAPLARPTASGASAAGACSPRSAPPAAGRPAWCR